MNALVQTNPRNATAAALVAAPALEPTQYLTFLLGSEVFAIGILAIKEIIEYHGVTEVPMMPASVRGVINLRGAVMPVIDLGARLGMDTSEPTARHVIIVAKVGDHSVGLVVDAVCETFAVTPEQVQPLPDLGGEAMRTVVQGFLQVDERMISLISLDKLLADTLAESRAAA